MERLTGLVKLWIPARGFGIIGEGKVEHLCHISAITASVKPFKALKSGDTVEFELSERNGRREASKVTAPGGGPVEGTDQDPGARGDKEPTEAPPRKSGPYIPPEQWNGMSPEERAKVKGVPLVSGPYIPTDQWRSMTKEERRAAKGGIGGGSRSGTPNYIPKDKWFAMSPQERRVAKGRVGGRTTFTPTANGTLLVYTRILQ